MVLGKVPSAMVLRLAFLYMCLSFVAEVEGLSHYIRAWIKSSLTLCSLLWMSFTISSCCNLGERVCSCLLLLGWKGCHLVYLFAVARVQGLAQSLFRRLGSSDPPFTSLTSPAWRLFIICSWGGSACSSANLGAKHLQKIMFSPFACCVFMCFPSYFIPFYVVFLFP